MAMARRYHAWAPNIAVKLPAVAAGLDVLEDCVAEGITTAATVSFTVPQAVAIAERCRAGRQRALKNGVKPGECFAVIMIGRLDDYLREVAADNRAPVSESDIRQSGLAATKRAYRIYQERGYEAVLLVAALRGDYHLTELAGADLVMSIAPGPAGVVRDRRPSLRGAHRHGRSIPPSWTGSARCPSSSRPTSRTAWRRTTSSPTDRRSARCASSSRQAGS